MACPAPRWRRRALWLCTAIPQGSRCSYGPADQWKVPPAHHRNPTRTAARDTAVDRSLCRSHGRQRYSPVPRHRHPAHPAADSDFDHASSPAHTRTPLSSHPRSLVNLPRRNRFILVGFISPTAGGRRKRASGKMIEPPQKRRPQKTAPFSINHQIPANE